MRAQTRKQQPSAQAAPGVLTYTRTEAAKELKISESMLDILTKQGKIAVCKVGRRKLYRPQALADYLTRTETKPRAA